MTDYIVAIDLGSSHITGIVGEKNADGTFSIVACETENTFSCIRRGNIYNLDDTADHVGDLIKKLEGYLRGSYIEKVYIGVGGQSLRTTDHVESKDIAGGAVVTKDDIKELKERCEKYTPDLLDVLDIAPAVYYLDGRRETKPVGVPCKRFEAHYKLVIGRASIRRDILNSIRDRAKIEIAGIIVSPLALADAMLSKEEKELGCALVDFGAGVTSVCVYKDENLLHMSVIPLGSNLITRDITSLQLTEAEAEKLKKEHGSAILHKAEESEVISVDMEGVDRKIEANDLNAIIEGRAKEIVENVYAQINEVVEVKSLGSGIVLAGCAAELKNLPELIRDRCKAKVRHSAIYGGLVRGSDHMLGDPLYMPAISLMLKGTKSCVSHPFAEQETENASEAGANVDPTTEKDVNRNPTVKKESVKKNKRKTFSGLIKDIFNEE
ncbi:MAG: cell division protein FtsA [Tannerella sp.]|jgi:cell division protein FtsA|nr:cell division protein FtsA [Tannerella sp.]